MTIEMEDNNTYHNSWSVIWQDISQAGTIFSQAVGKWKYSLQVKY